MPVESAQCPLSHFPFRVMTVLLSQMPRLNFSVIPSTDGSAFGSLVLEVSGSKTLEMGFSIQLEFRFAILQNSEGEELQVCLWFLEALCI